jgi:hypothetical protein
MNWFVYSCKQFYYISMTLENQNWVNTGKPFTNQDKNLKAYFFANATEKRVIQVNIDGKVEKTIVSIHENPIDENSYYIVEHWAKTLKLWRFKLLTTRPNGYFISSKADVENILKDTDTVNYLEA